MSSQEYSPCLLCMSLCPSVSAIASAAIHTTISSHMSETPYICRDLSLYRQTKTWGVPRTFGVWREQRWATTPSSPTTSTWTRRTKTSRRPRATTSACIPCRVGAYYAHIWMHTHMHTRVFYAHNHDFHLVNNQICIYGHY